MNLEKLFQNGGHWRFRDASRWKSHLLLWKKIRLKLARVTVRFPATANSASAATCAGPQRKNFSGGMKVDTAPPNFIGPPKPYWWTWR